MVDGKTKFSLKRFVSNMKLYRGRHTELISVYIPADYDINQIINQLSQEAGTATNIKSASTRNNVITALEKMNQLLKTIGRTPENGLVAFSGNVSEREGQQDFQTFHIEPPIPLKTKIYRCDKEFVTEPLEEMVEDKDVYGLVVLDQRDATIATLRGKAITVLKTTHSEVPGKMRAGGQSAPRFQRLRQDAVNSHFKKVASYMKDEFLMMEGLKGIILGGPGTTVNNFMNAGHVTGDVQKKIIGTKDLSYTGEFGLQELLDRSEDLLVEEEVAKEKKLMNDFFKLLSTGTNKYAYGREDCIRLIEMGAVDILLLSESVDDKDVDYFEEICEAQGTQVELISRDTREGEQLFQMGKYAAILRYEV
ncbi:MAG: peptide chain release factor aRF-1 [Candidatus Woesearchaeota archaeon]